MPFTLSDYLRPQRSPEARPDFEFFHAGTRQLHSDIDQSIRRRGIPYLHPQDPTLQLDMLGSRHMIDWQQRKAEQVLAGEKCWSDLHQFYARYGVETTRSLIAEVMKLENAAGAILTDCGMQAAALAFDVIARPRGHAVLFRGVYNKTRRYLEWLSQRLDLQVTLVDGGDPDTLRREVRRETLLIFGETYTNPLMRALDPRRLGELSLELKRSRAPALQLLIDNTIATPWGLKKPLLDTPGVDIVIASGTKALAGQDRDLWGYVASKRIDFLNEVMDLQAMRGGILDWRRAQAILEGLDSAQENFRRRCRTAEQVARFLAQHPKVEQVHHPGLPQHVDAAIIQEHYRLPGSLLSFKIAGADEDQSRHFADVLATCAIFRYAGSFDGLTTKINHHKSVSEYFTPEEELEKAGITRILRLGIGLEDAEDLIACLNWALWNFEAVSPEEVLAWQKRREESLQIRGER